MKKLFKWLFRLILVLVLLVVVLIVFLDPIAKALTERLVRSQTGMEVKIGRVSIGFKSPTVTVENFKLINSPDFGGTTFLDVPELHIQYDLQALRERKVHLNLVRLNVGELHIVQNKDGKTNLQALKERQKRKSSSSTSSTSKAEFEGIDTFTLAVGRLKYTSQKNPTNNQEIYVGLRNQTVKNVRSAKDLQPLITRIALEKGADFLSENLLNTSTNALQNATNAVEKEGRKTLDGLTDKPKQ